MKQNTTTQPVTFTLSQDGETLTFEFNKKKAFADWHSTKEPEDDETFFDWCKNTYPYTDKDGGRPIENGNLSPNYSPNKEQDRTSIELKNNRVIDSYVLHIKEEKILIPDEIANDVRGLVYAWNNIGRLGDDNKRLMIALQNTIKNSVDIAGEKGMIEEENEKLRNRVKYLEDLISEYTLKMKVNLSGGKVGEFLKDAIKPETGTPTLDRHTANPDDLPENLFTQPKN